MNTRKNRDGGRAALEKTTIRCAIYTRKSTDEGLEKDFNSLDAQRESAEAYIASMKHEGWVCLPDRYDDGGYSGGNVERPALKRLIEDVEAGKVDLVLTYKVDRLSRSLMDFSKMMAMFDRKGVSFVSVTQHFNTTNSMGRLTLNILLSFAQFEREIISERTRDKMSAARRKGKWAGGPPPLGYDVLNGKLVINPAEADQVREVFRLYSEQQSIIEVVRQLNDKGWTTKRWKTKKGTIQGGYPFTKSNVYLLLRNVTYAGQVKHQDQVYPGEHRRIVDRSTFDRVQELLEERGRSGAGGPKVGGGGLLSGLLRCRGCSCAMSHTYTQKGPRRYRYYTCGRASKRGYAVCPNPSVAARAVEEFVVDQIREIGRDPDLVTATFAEVERRLEDEIQAGNATIDRLEAELRDLYGELSEAALRPDQVEPLARIQSRIDAQQRFLAENRDQIRSLENEGIGYDEVARALESFDDVWEALTVRERNDLLRKFLDNVEFDGVAGEITLHFQAGMAQFTPAETAA